MTKPNNPLAEFQAEFSGFLLQANSQPQPGLSAWMALQPCSQTVNSKRIDLGLRVYRNNVIYSLTQALAAQFPVVNKLVGPDFFTALARDYVRQEPPLDPSLTYYGHLFASFVESLPACQPLPYLADVARLELHCQRALNAADDPVLDLEQLGALQPGQLEEARISLNSSAFLFTSSYPVDRIWAANLEDNEEEIRLESRHEYHMLIYRRDMQVQVVSLQPTAFSFLQQLQRGDSLGEACTHIQHKHAIEATEFPPLLSYLLGLDVFSRFTLQPVKEIS